MGELFAFEAGIEVHFDIVPAPREVEAGRNVGIELEIGEAIDLLGHFGGDFRELGERLVVFDTRSEGIAEPEAVAEADPVIFAKFVKCGEGVFAVIFEVIVPDGGDGLFVVVPEFAFAFGAIDGFGGEARS